MGGCPEARARALTGEELAFTSLCFQACLRRLASLSLSKARIWRDNALPR